MLKTVKVSIWTSHNKLQMLFEKVPNYGGRYPNIHYPTRQGQANKSEEIAKGKKILE